MRVETVYCDICGKVIPSDKERYNANINYESAALMDDQTLVSLNDCHDSCVTSFIPNLTHAIVMAVEARKAANKGT